MASVPKFLRVLYDLLDTEPASIIAWSPCGTFFQVHDAARLEKYVLPRYFKHNKFASFQRQLNNFGFRKWVCKFSHDVLVRCKPSELQELMVNYSKPVSAAPSGSHKRPRAESPSKCATKKLKTVDAFEFEIDSSVDSSDLLALDWFMLTDDDNVDEFCEDGSVGLPIELCFQDALDGESGEPLKLGESTELAMNDWRLLAQCLV